MKFKTVSVLFNLDYPFIWQAVFNNHQSFSQNFSKSLTYSSSPEPPSPFSTKHDKSITLYKWRTTSFLTGDDSIAVEICWRLFKMLISFQLDCKQSWVNEIPICSYNSPPPPILRSCNIAIKRWHLKFFSFKSTGPISMNYMTNHHLVTKNHASNEGHSFVRRRIMA